MLGDERQFPVDFFFFFFEVEGGTEERNGIRKLNHLSNFLEDSA